MVYTYTPTYYSSLHDSITSLCKTILPFSFKKKRLTAAEQRLSKLQSDNLKWQQDSFHQILKLMGLHKEEIIGESEVSAFRTHMLETLIASPAEHEQGVILKDKLVFLQDLLYAKCISEDEYHSSKRPLFQRLAVQGAEIEAIDVIVSDTKDRKESSEEEWSVIDLRDEKTLVSKDSLQANIKSKPNSTSSIKPFKQAASAFGFGSSHKHSKQSEEKSIFEIEANFVNNEKENPALDNRFKGRESETKSILKQEGLHSEARKESENTDTARRKPFRGLLHREHNDRAGESGGGNGPPHSKEASKSTKKQWGLDGFKKWKRNDSDDETTPLSFDKSSDSKACLGPDNKQIKKKLHSNGSLSDISFDKVFGDNIKEELSRIQTELSTRNPNHNFSNDQIEAISTKLPVDKADLKEFFPKSWCDRHGDVVLDVMKKELKDHHAGEIADMRYLPREEHNNNSMQWTTFDDDDENSHPNLFAHHEDNNNSSFLKTSTFQDQNPFWSGGQY